MYVNKKKNIIQRNFLKTLTKMIHIAADKVSATNKFVHYTRKTRAVNNDNCFYYVTFSSKNERI